MIGVNLLFNYVQKCVDDGPFISKNNISFNNVKLKKRNSFIRIKNHIDKFLDGDVNNRFVCMSGLRGVGKSTLIFQLYDYLQKKGIANERILYFSAGELKQLLNNDICDVVEAYVNDYHGVYDEISEKIFIFVDEVQEFSDCFQQAKYICNISPNIFLLFAGNDEVNNLNKYNITKYEIKEDMSPLNYGEYLSINYGVKINNKLPLNLVNTIFTGQLNDVPDLERKFYRSFSNRDLFMNKSLEHFLLCGSFPESMNLNVYWGHKQIFDNLVDIIVKDVFSKDAYTPRTKDKIYKVLSFIAFHQSGNFTNASLAKFTKISYSHLFNILDNLESLNLIFHIEPCGSKKGVKRSRNYYFTSPNFHAAINSQIGNFTPKNTEYLEVLVKSYVASSLVMMKNNYAEAFDIFIPQGNNHSDFIIVKNGDYIPIEVSFGRKPKMNIHNTLDECNCEYGVVISDAITSVRKTYDVIHIPINTFSLI